MAKKKITIVAHAVFELDPADFGWVDALDPEKLKHRRYELLGETMPVELVYSRNTIRGTLFFTYPQPQQLKAAWLESNREA